MDIKTQKIIRFIPIVNFITVVFWFLMYYKNPISKKRLYKKLLVVGLYCLLIMIVEIIFNSIVKIDMLATLVSFVASYLSLLAFSFIAVRDQEKYFDEQSKKD